MISIRKDFPTCDECVTKSLYPNHCNGTRRNGASIHCDTAERHRINNTYHGENYHA
ncbi:hypothetical protein Q31b_37370 [Novipirellula aureliae]|uniref:Uncharacterized protein n=1 Tax=Novipirellula aureliae TaxID=2527966 RepID=A0A5C6DV48_9BACT|nr:hypothetical protein Q31b_37370 [Novipirellula aureliae]